MQSICSRCGHIAPQSNGKRDYCETCLNLRDANIENPVKRRCDLCANMARFGRKMCRPCNTKSIQKLKQDAGCVPRNLNLN